MAAYSARFKGLKELDRALGKADKEARKKLRDNLRDIAQDVATEARAIAESKGLRDSGDLINGIKPYALMGRAGVRSTAVHDGFPYPLRLEFEGRKGQAWGPRASLYPALEKKQDDVNRKAEQLLDRLVSDLEGN